MRHPSARGPALPVAIGGLLVTTAAMALAARRGIDPSVALGFPALAAGGLLLLANARLAVAAAVGVFALFETGPTFGIAAAMRVYESTPFFFSPAELLMYFALAAVALDVLRRGEGLRLPGVFTLPLLLLVSAWAFGILNGHFSGGAESYAVRSFLQTGAPLIIYPLLIVNVVRTREDLRTAIGVLAALAVLKGVIGLAGVATGRTDVNSLGGPRLTYYEAAANFLMLVTLLGVIAARLSGVRLTQRWLRWSGPILFFGLLLSYRRSFWLASLATIALVTITATGNVGRRLAIPILLLVIGCGWLVSQSKVVGDLQGPVVARASTITVSKVTTNTQDRYRLAERRDAVADLKEQPLAGLGVGVPWSMRYPLPFDAPSGRQYIHFAPVWWWFKLGLIGLAAYACLLVTTLVSGVRVWRRHPDAAIRAAGLAGGVVAIGACITDLAATTIGPDIRTTALFATVMGLLAVAHAQSPTTSTATLRP